MEKDEAATHDEASAPQQEPQPSMTVDDMIEKSIGRINYAQILQAFLASIPTFFDGQQTFISIFAHAQPKWHCTYSTATSTCTPSSNICSLPKTEWAWNSGKTHTSIISEWDLECANSFITSLPTTCYFVGCLLGGFVLPFLGDSSWLGRRNLLFGSTLLMCLSALAASFSPNVWVYSGLRLLSGVGRAPITISALVLLTERVGKQWRPQIAMVGFILFSLGTLALTGIAYATRDLSWRILYMSTSVPGIVLCTMSYFFLLESPRWLLMQGQESNAMVILRRLGSSSLRNQIFPGSSLNLFNAHQINKETITTSNNPFVSLKILIKKGWAIRRLLASMVLGFGVGLIYFGMFLGVENLGFNIYLTSTFNSILSMASYLITFLFWIQRFNRRSSLLGFCIISGTTSIVFSVLHGAHEGVVVSLELVSLFCASMAYNMLLMYMVELFPTCVRNSASSLVRQAIILGSIFDPMLTLLGKKNRIYSYGVFGSAMLLFGFLVLCLPETRGKALCDTMEEQELRDYGNESNSP